VFAAIAAAAAAAAARVAAAVCCGVKRSRRRWHCNRKPKCDKKIVGECAGVATVGEKDVKNAWRHTSSRPTPAVLWPFELKYCFEHFAWKGGLTLFVCLKTLD
jgi:hypothetical protein